jgi:septum formation protein
MADHDLAYVRAAQHRLEAREDHARGARHLACPLSARGVHEQGGLLETNRCRAGDRGTDRGLPRELDFPRGERRVAQQGGERAGQRLAEWMHEEPERFDLISLRTYHSGMRLVLASASPRRAELLAAAGFVFETCPVDVDETPADAESPAGYVRRLAAEKSAAALEKCRAADRAREQPVILGADTTVVLDGEILAKPRDDVDAVRMIEKLSGRPHDVLTGVSLRTAEAELGGVVVTTVWFNTLTEQEIAWYVGTGEGRDKAGAYAIQGLGSRFIPRIEGSYTNVVGLPVAAVSELLQRLGGRAGITY